MRKMLMLGGAWSQIPAIKRAKELGYYVITCDYLPQNPGHKYADEYKNISTTDREEVLQFAKEKRVDGIIAYASDPSAKAAAYVCDRLALPGAAFHTVEMMCEKDRFREFQQKNGFFTPRFVTVSDRKELESLKGDIPCPCIIKPVDSSGSKGITKVKDPGQIPQAFELAKQFSKCGRVILEEYVPSTHCQLHGDGIVCNGKLQFLALGDQRFYHSVPIGSSFPSQIEDRLMQKAVKEVSRLIELADFSCGGINVEVRITEEEDVFIVEIGPRTGGNYVPQLMQTATEVDEVSAVLKMAMGECPRIEEPKFDCFCFQYIIGGRKKGSFQEIYIDGDTQKKVERLFIHKKAGDPIDGYHNSSEVVGVAILRFKSREEMESTIQNIEKHIQVRVEETV